MSLLLQLVTSDDVMMSQCNIQDCKNNLISNTIKHNNWSESEITLWEKICNNKRSTLEATGQDILETL